MNAGKRIIFMLLASTLSLIAMVGAVLVVDLYLHHRYESVAGLNIHGYRGPVAKRKQPGEQRIVVLGGSTALGYGLRWEESFPNVLERKVNEARQEHGQGPVSIVNLAANSEGAYAFKYNLRAYRHLDYDIALFYTGYNDLGSVPNTSSFRKNSPIFQLTGYMPIFPLIFTEKAMAIRYNGNIEGAYRGERVVFKPNAAQRATASALETIVSINKSLENQIGRLTNRPSDEEFAMLTESGGCGERWAFYCEQVSVAVDLIIREGKRAIVVTQPYISDKHISQQQAMVSMLRQQFGDNKKLRCANLGLVVDLKDPTLAYDGMHLTALGNEQVADHLLDPVLEVLDSGR